MMETEKEQVKEKKNNLLLISILGTIIGLCIFFSIFYIVSFFVTHEKVYITEKITMDSLWKYYPSNYNIICEDGVVVENGGLFTYSSIWGCLSMCNGNCCGNGKICLIKHNEWRLKK